MRSYLLLTVLSTLLFVSIHPLHVHGIVGIEGMKKDIDIPEKGQQAIHKELVEVKTIPGQKPVQPQFKETVVSVEDQPSRGNKKAKLALIEFSDYQ